MEAITRPFDTFEQNHEGMQTSIHPRLLQLMERMENSLVYQMDYVAKQIRQTRVDNISNPDVAVVTPEHVFNLMKQQITNEFIKLRRRIADYSLVNMNNPQESSVFLDLECLEEDLVIEISNLVRSWR